jgi:hypothetical protein
MEINIGGVFISDPEPIEMIDAKAIVLFRANLPKDRQEKSFNQITLSDFKYDGSVRKAYESEIIMFVDTDRRTKILKNRWGNMGTVK